MNPKQEGPQIDIGMLLEEYDLTIKSLIAENLRYKTLLKQQAKKEQARMEAEIQAQQMDAPPAAPAAPVVEIIEPEEDVA